MSIYEIPLSVPKATEVLVIPVALDCTAQFVGNVPGVPALAPCIVLFLMLFVRCSSIKNPSGAKVAGLWFW
jgi:hypothetical protein